MQEMRDIRLFSLALIFFLFTHLTPKAQANDNEGDAPQKPEVPQVESKETGKEMQAEPEAKEGETPIEQAEQSSKTITRESSPDEIEAVLKEADIASRHNNFEEAITLCNQVLNFHADNMQALATRGAALVSAGKFKEGIVDLSKVLDSLKNPSLHSLYGARALAYLQLNQYENAIDDISNSLKVKPNKQQYWLIRAAAYHKSKEYEKAIADFSKGLALEPEGINAAIFLAGRSDSYAALGRNDACLKDLNKILKIAPKDPNAWMNRALLFIKTKDWAKSVSDLDNVIDFAPMGQLSNQALVLRAESNKNCGRFQDSIRDFTSLLAGYPKEPGFLFGRAEARLAADESEAALKDINKCIEQINNEPRYFELRAKIYDSLKRTDEADKDRAEAKSLPPAK